MPSRGGKWDRDKLIFPRRRPTNEGQTSALPEGRVKVVERGVRIVEEHDPEARKDEIETCCGKRIGLRVSFLEMNVLQIGFLCQRTCGLDQLGGDIDAQD